VRTRVPDARSTSPSSRSATTSLLKALGVPPKDAQVILAHAHASTTEQIYSHVNETAMREAITKLNRRHG